MPSTCRSGRRSIRRRTPSCAPCRHRAASAGIRRVPDSAELRRAIVDWIGRRFGVAVEASQVAACVGTKEFVGTLPQWLRLRRPDRDTVLYPEIAYPTYEMGAILAGAGQLPCR